MLRLVDFRKAEPADLKNDSRTLKVGQTYAVISDANTVEGIFAIRGDEDPFILKHYLENEMLWIPNNNPNFPEWIRNLESEDGSPEEISAEESARSAGNLLTENHKP